MQIYRTGNRLFMIMETSDRYIAKRKAAMDAVNLKVQILSFKIDNSQIIVCEKPGKIAIGNREKPATLEFCRDRLKVNYTINLSSEDVPEEYYARQSQYTRSCLE